MEKTTKKDRIPLSLDLLTVLGHRINKLEWSEYSKQVVWTACLVSFFSSCRMGEILSLNEKGFDPKTTLVWKNVKLLDDSEILMYIPFSKSTGFKGKIVDIFPTGIKRLGPSLALIRLKKMAGKERVYDPEMPVFSFKKGKFLTKLRLNNLLENLLEDFTDENHRITGHSFRSAIPSLLESHPDKNRVDEIKEWGGWISGSYSHYTKRENDRRRILFSKIVDCMLYEI